MRCFWIAVLSAAPAFAQPDAHELVRRSIANGERSWRTSFDYSCIKTDIDRQFDASSRRVKTASHDVYQIVPLGYGSSFELHIRHDNEPLPRQEQIKEQQELEKRRAESPAQKRRRFEKEESERSYMKEVPDAFDFRIVGEQTLPTGRAWVVEATPRPGYRPKSRYARVFPSMRGKLWIDEKDVQWVKADAIAEEPVTFGFFIARLARGSHIVIEQARLADGDWVPKRIDARASARTFVFWNHNFEEDITYSDYRKGASTLAAAGR
ncbi:MAG TPA: hypothetical protein VGF59_21100 [Bryobacteraceae bacterium]